MLAVPPAETPEQGALRGSVCGIVRRHLPGSRAVDLGARPGLDPVSWRAFADAGLPGPGAGADVGGRGGAARDLRPGIAAGTGVPAAAMSAPGVGTDLPRSD